MKRTDLEVEHIYKGKFVGRHRFRSSRRTRVLGRGRTADVRLMGDDVGDIHAYIECQGDSWTISDAGSSSGTWLDKNPLVFESVREPTTIIIGGHTLKLIPRHIEKSVFSKVESEIASPSSVGAQSHNESLSKTQLFHQVIVMKGEQLVRTELLSPRQSFRFEFGGRAELLAAPDGNGVVEKNFGPYRIVQRLVKTDVMNFHEGGWKTLLTSSDTRVPFITAIVFILLLIGLIIAVPKRPNDALHEIKPDDQYTRMVFDAKLMRQVREQASAMRKVFLSHAPAPAANSVRAPVQFHRMAPALKIVKNLNSGALGALLGKIAKRADINGPKIAGFGKIADDANTGPASTTFDSIGSLQGIHTNVGRSGGTFNVQGVGTAGLGGGRSIAGLGGLASGGAGSGTVGILTEETKVEGGLDKDVIAAVINSHLGEIRYCYERELSADPNLYGKMQVKFVIDASGSVINPRIGISTLQNAMVEGCILRRLVTWQFPRPKGGTKVFVTYPFMFKAIN